jgi:hypothetical protein
MSGRKSKKLPFVAVATHGVAADVVDDVTVVAVASSADDTLAKAAIASSRRLRDEVCGCILAL